MVFGQRSFFYVYICYVGSEFVINCLGAGYLMELHRLLAKEENGTTLHSTHALKSQQPIVWASYFNLDLSLNDFGDQNFLRQQKRGFKNQKPCSFFDIEEHLSKTKRELLHILRGK